MITEKSPLEGKSIGTIAKVAIRELPGLHMIDLRVTPATSAQTAVVEALGIHLPEKPWFISCEAESLVLCLAPDWWLIIGSQEVEQELETLRLTSDHHFSIVDVSGQRTTIELEGLKVREVIAHLWEQDIREKSFPIGSVSQGLMAKSPVIVCHVATLRYRVIVRSSFALHLWKALVDAAEEWL